MTDYELREILLASLRVDLLDEIDSGMINLSPELEERRSHLRSEHAIDAALARGATLTSVLRITPTEVGWDDFDWPEDDPEVDVALVNDSLSDAGDEWLGMTFGAFKRHHARLALAGLSSLVASRGSHGVVEEFGRRCAEQGLDRERVLVVDVLPEPELRAVFEAGLVQRRSAA